MNNTSRFHFETRVIYFRLREDAFVVFFGAAHDGPRGGVGSGGVLWNSYLRLIGGIYPCLLRLMVSYPVRLPAIKLVAG